MADKPHVLSKPERDYVVAGLNLMLASHLRAAKAASSDAVRMAHDGEASTLRALILRVENLELAL